MIDFSLFYEYLNDADMERAQAADKAWREKMEARQEQAFRKIMAMLIAKTGFGRFFSWL